MQWSECVTAIYHVDSCQEGELAGHTVLFWTTVLSVLAFKKMALLKGKILMNSYVILDNVFYN